MSDGVKIFDLAVAFLLSCRHSSSTKKSPMRSSMFISTYFLHTTNSKLVGTTYNEISCLVHVSFFFLLYFSLEFLSAIMCLVALVSSYRENKRLRYCSNDQDVSLIVFQVSNEIKITQNEEKCDKLTQKMCYKPSLSDFRPLT
jgi:hypothetical protein